MITKIVHFLRLAYQARQCDGRFLGRLRRHAAARRLAGHPMAATDGRWFGTGRLESTVRPKAAPALACRLAETCCAIQICLTARPHPGPSMPAAISQCRRRLSTRRRRSRRCGCSRAVCKVSWCQAVRRPPGTPPTQNQFRPQGCLLSTGCRSRPSLFPDGGAGLSCRCGAVVSLGTAGRAVADVVLPTSRRLP